MSMNTRPNRIPQANTRKYSISHKQSGRVRWLIISSLAALSIKSELCLAASHENKIHLEQFARLRNKALPIMPPKTTSKVSEVSSADASVLRDLKDLIRKQAEEIKDLKKEILTMSCASKVSAPSTGHGHGGGGEEVDVNAYLSTPFYKLAFKRVGWLSFFLCSLSLTAVIMNGFEHILEKQLELAYFVPLLAGHGGNTGGQTVGTVLSALSVGAISKNDAFRVITKEASSGIMVGIILGSCIGPIAYYFGGISLHVSTVVFCTLPLLSTIAATLASSIPFLCTLLGLDPALISAPAMTTFVDVSGLLSYFLIATFVFKLFGLEL